MDSPNPYASPPSTEYLTDVPNAEGVITPAGKGSRFANLLIDYLSQTGLGIVVAIVIGLVGGEEAIELLEGGIANYAFGIMILLGYYWVFEVTTQRTIGKLITGTSVVSSDGAVPSIGQITGRTFARLIPFEAFSFLGTPARGWHDSLSGTLVVKTRVS